MSGKFVALSAALLLWLSNPPGWAQSQSTTSPQTKSGNQAQPQGETGPINTKPGGAPASSPQGDTPGGMQAAPMGSGVPVKTESSGEPTEGPKK